MRFAPQGESLIPDVRVSAGHSGVRDPDGTAQGAVYALNPDTGEVLWEQDLGGTVIAPVTVANGLVYVSSTVGLLVFNGQTGEVVWDDGGYGLLYSQTVVQDGTIYSTYLNGDVVARRLIDTQPPREIVIHPRRRPPAPRP